MGKDPGFEELIARLADGEIVSLSVPGWDRLGDRFPLVEAVETGMAGRILLLRRDLPGQGKRRGWAIVEEPEPQARVIRPLQNEKEARALIADRLAAYERMWDG